MNTLLTKHVEQEEGKTKAESVQAYIRAWENAGYLLRPLFLMLKEREDVLRNTRDEDFTIFNHYAKVMFNRGKEEEVKAFLALLPKKLND
jgi:hypothetical protein